MTMPRWMLAIAVCLPGAPAFAQEGAQRIATCNVLKVMEAMQERRAYEAELAKKENQIDQDRRRREADIRQLQKERDDLRPGTQLYDEKNEQLLKLVIESDVNIRMRQAEHMRWQKTRLREMYEKVREAAKEVATQKQIDLVLAERRNDLQVIDPLTVDQVKAIIVQNDVVFAGQKADITQDVLLAVDKKYTLPGGAAPR